VMARPPTRPSPATQRSRTARFWRWHRSFQRRTTLLLLLWKLQRFGGLGRSALLDRWSNSRWKSGHQRRWWSLAGIDHGKSYVLTASQIPALIAQEWTQTSKSNTTCASSSCFWVIKEMGTDNWRRLIANYPLPIWAATPLGPPSCSIDNIFGGATTWWVYIHGIYKAVGTDVWVGGLKERSLEAWHAWRCLGSGRKVTAASLPERSQYQLLLVPQSSL
jgi:hypothetical protein